MTGEVLREDYLVPLEMNVDALAMAIQADCDLRTMSTREEIEHRVHRGSELAKQD